jgi:hypothetical protein
MCVWCQRPSAFLGLSPLASTKKSSWLQQFWHLAWRSGKDAARNVQLTIGKVRDPVLLAVRHRGKAGDELG